MLLVRKGHHGYTYSQERSRLKLMSKILLVEDDPLIYRLYQKVFALEGFETELAENGQLGLDKLKTFHPDIILLDIMMRTMNGIEMLTKLKSDASTANIPVVVLTNLSDMHVAQMAISRGAVQILIKSETEPKEVISLIRGVLENSPLNAPIAHDEPAKSE
jgi:CheY-like chemotaxis protein